jgi:hypothetical protein
MMQRSSARISSGDDAALQFLTALPRTRSGLAMNRRKFVSSCLRESGGWAALRISTRSVGVNLAQRLNAGKNRG